MIKQQFENLINCQTLIIKLLPLADFDDFIKSFMLTVIKKHSHLSIWEKKVNSNNYFDLYKYDTLDSFKKNDVIEIIDTFSKPGIEDIDLKFLVIKNIEYANKQTLNSLLKFIETPPRNVYIIFSCKNYNAILPTIKSRCISIYLEKDQNKIDKILKQNNLDKELYEIIQKCYFDLEKLQEDCCEFKNYYDFAKLLSSKNKKTNIECYKTFKNYDYSEINLILEILKQINWNKIDPNAFVALQDDLYLNPNKSLILNNIFDIFVK